MIAITRGEEAASNFIEMAKEVGINVIALDLIRLIPNTKEIERLKSILKDKRYDYLLFMSANTIDILDQSILPLLRENKIIAIGPKTRASLENHDLRVSLMPAKYSSYGIVELFKSIDVKGKRILIPRSSASDNYLRDNLTRLGLEVKEVYVYDIKYNIDKNLDKFVELLMNNMITCIIFTSASNVDAFFTLIKDLKLVEKVHKISIGPFTANRLKTYGMDSIIANEHTLEGIFKELSYLMK